MIISQTDASRELGISRAAINKQTKKNPMPAYFIQVDKKIKVDTEHPLYIKKLNEVDPDNKPTPKATPKKEKKKIVKVAEVVKATPKKETPAPALIKPTHNMELENLIEEAQTAELLKVIYDSKIKKEKAKQAEIDTLEKQKDLAPIEMIKHFFSFSENMIGRLYRRPHEISPQLKAYYLAGEDLKATQQIVKEMETIVRDTVKDLLADLKSAGFKYKG